MAGLRLEGPSAGRIRCSGRRPDSESAKNWAKGISGKGCHEYV